MQGAPTGTSRMRTSTTACLAYMENMYPATWKISPMWIFHCDKQWKKVKLIYDNILTLRANIQPSNSSNTFHTVEPGYIECEGEQENVWYIGNMLYQIKIQKFSRGLHSYPICKIHYSMWAQCIHVRLYISKLAQHKATNQKCFNMCEIYFISLCSSVIFCLCTSSTHTVWRGHI